MCTILNTSSAVWKMFKDCHLSLFSFRICTFTFLRQEINLVCESFFIPYIASPSRLMINQNTEQIVDSREI